LERSYNVVYGFPCAVSGSNLQFITPNVIALGGTRPSDFAKASTDKPDGFAYAQRSIRHLAKFSPAHAGLFSWMKFSGTRTMGKLRHMGKIILPRN
jgi:hypothetical protein